ncbi:hypothetical protein M153_2990008943 [Pseudoloma neurophilia]|uniref:Uncharacterized protein n=1 Tax=Pseudoloma neurophilia TaxID=146866 RepID=A0A0R0M2H2_9MICR|nr:hypothetical protein M153_2990008943 [Pseudoloma neurophilia]
MHKKEIDCLLMTVFSYLSIIFIGVSFYMDSKPSKGASTASEIRLYSYLLIEANYIYCIWKYFETNGTDNILKMFFLQIFLLKNYLKKQTYGEKFTFFDLLIFFARLVHLVNVIDRIRIEKVCYHCRKYSIEDNIVQILKMRSAMKIISSLYYMFVVMNLIYCWLRNQFLCFISCSLLTLTIYIVENYDRDEKILPRCLILILNVLSVIQNQYLIWMAQKLNE